ncbi:MAG: hypothetical protein WBE26_15755, partial [Phycisphaerae bacterium]
MPRPPKVSAMKPNQAAGVGRPPVRPLLSEEAWREAIKQRTVHVGIMGMGYVGLPLMRTFCAAGFSCLGFDVDITKVERLNAGKSYIKHIPSSQIRALVEKEWFVASDDPKSLRECDALLICVPTP